MAFVLTVIYITLSLISAEALPTALMGMHLNQVFGVLVILSLIPALSKSRLTSTPDAIFLTGLLLGTIFSSIATGWFGSAVSTFMGFVPILSTFYFVAMSCNSLKRIKALIFVLTLIALFILANGYFAFRSGNFISEYLLPEGIGGNVIYRFKGLGVLSDPNDLAQLFVAIIPLLWLRWKKDSFVGNFFLTLLPSTILAVGVYFTHSRGGSIALIAVLLFGFKDKLGFVRSSILAAAALSLLLALNVSGGRGMDEDDGGRVGKWYVGLQVFKTHPFFGAGVGNFANYDEAGQTAHNSYVLTLAEEGIFGYFFWLGLLVSNWNGLTRILRLEDAYQPEPEDETAYDLRSPHKKRLASLRPWHALSETAPLASTGGSASKAPTPSSSYTSDLQKPPKVDYVSHPSTIGEYDDAADLPDDESLAYAARILRVSLVGFLAAAFFLSRNYSLTLYILLGLATSLKILDLRKYPGSQLGFLAMTKRVAPVLFVSIMVLYLVVRIHGA